ncbi:unnamed protein product [Phytomonas sp. Hart1]|nr:unnamed protein product [Phytomonas sp. Hart1]|eukprot:CCW70757.1 unnamed protein product [Phytomonas sp. isolate Hart1]
MRYGKHGYDFFTHLQLHGARLTEGFTRLRVGLYTLGTAAGVFYALLWLTSYRFRLTTDPSPYSNYVFAGFPSDYVEVENIWTGRRRVITFDAEDAAGGNDAASHPGEPNPGPTAKPPPRIREKTITINRFKDRLHVYQQKARAVVVVDAAAELTADRFVRAREGAAIHRRDQLFFPDFPPPSSRENDWESGEARGEGASSSPAPSRVYVEAWIRPREAENRLQRGALPVFEETTRRVIQEKLQTRYFDLLLAKNAEKMEKIYAEALLRSGVVRGGGVGLLDVVPDRRPFAEEVLAEVKRRLGDRVILCEYHLRFF